MLTLKIDGLQQTREALKAFSDRRFTSAVATALTRTASVIGKQWTGQLQSRFDRPTPATQRAVVVKRAENTAEVLTAEVKLRDQLRGRGTPPVEWLATQELGGQRRIKKFEQALQAQGSMPAGWKAVPGPGAKLDGFGNVTRGQIVQVIAQLGAQFSPGYARVISASAARRAARAVQTGRAYVAIQPGNKTGLTPGVYERAGKALRPVFFFVKSASYSRRLNLIGAGMREAQAVLNREFARAVSESAARLTQRSAGR